MRGVYFHGLPYAEAKQYATPEYHAPLLTMLQNTEEAPYWPNITMVLGLTGDDAVAEHLIDFVRGTEEWSTLIYRGRLSGVLGLGYLVHVSSRERGEPNMEAMTYLVDSVRPEKWTERNIPWVMGRGDEERLRVQLSVSAVLGLALAGTNEAAEYLAELQYSGEPRRVRRAAEAVQDDVAQINGAGLAVYYGAVQDESPQRSSAARH